MKKGECVIMSTGDVPFKGTVYEGFDPDANNKKLLVARIADIIISAKKVDAALHADRTGILVVINDVDSCHVKKLVRELSDAADTFGHESETIPHNGSTKFIISL